MDYRIAQLSWPWFRGLEDDLIFDVCLTNEKSYNQTSHDPDKKENYETNGIISSTQQIISQSNVIYDSATEVSLQPTFEVQLGSVFTVYIDGCGNIYWLIVAVMWVMRILTQQNLEHR